MSRMTYLNPPETSVDMITSFGGYNHNISISDGEFYDMENLSSDKFPLVSIRGKRVKLGKEIYGTVPDVNYIKTNIYYNAGNHLIAVNGGIYCIKSFRHTFNYSYRYAIWVFKYNENTNKWNPDYVPDPTSLDFADERYSSEPITSESYSVNMGAQIVIFPLKLVYNTVSKTLKKLEASATADIVISVVDHNDSTIGSWTVSSTEPTEPSNGAWWVDTSQKIHTLKRYSEASGMWASAQAYAKIAASEGAFDGFEESDAIGLSWVSGCAVIQPAENQKYWVIYKKGQVTGADYILIPINPKGQRSCSHIGATISRTMPVFDYITESNNRLWACRYGNDGSGETVNEIFASKLGDPTNWHYFANTSIDSYYLSLGVGGKFTGAVTYQSNPIFFKEDSIHRIYGSIPANYQLKSIMGYGVKDGSYKSVTELNDTVYYLSNSGITAYRGGVPVNMAEVFGVERYKDGIAVSTGNKAYFSLKDSANNRVLFIYDDRYGLWYKEGLLDLKDMLVYNSKVFCIQDYDAICLSEFSSIPSYEDSVEWSMDTGKIGFNTPYRKFITRVTFRLRIKTDARAAVYVQYDSDGTWQHVTDIRPTGRAEAIAVPFTPRRCDHFNIMLKGKGEIELISLTKFYEESSDYA